MTILQSAVDPSIGSSIPVLVLVSYLLILIGIGWAGYRRGKGDEEDYYLASRGQGWFVSSLTIMATFFSSFALLGAPGMVYREGVVFALVSLNVPVAGFGIYLLGSRIRAVGQARGYVTQADMFCDYYGSRVVLRLLIVIVGFLFVVPFVMIQLKAGGELASVLFPSQENAFQIGAIVIAGITAIYIMIGGMRSVAWTDAMQCILLTSGMLLAGVAMVGAMGGWTGFTQALGQLPVSSRTLPGNTGFWELPMLMSVCLFMGMGGVLSPPQWMRYYSARDRQTIQRSALIFIILLTGCFLLGIMLVGLGGQALYPLQFDQLGAVSPNPGVGSYDQILVVVMKYQLPNLLGHELGLLLASILIVAIMASSMSTADSNLHALGGLVTRDVYDRFIRPQATERERLWVGRFVILAASFLSLLVVLSGSREDSSFVGFMEMMVGLGLFGVAFSVQLLPIAIDVLFVRKGTSVAACAGLATGVVFAFMFTSFFNPLIEWIGFSSLLSLASLIEWVKAALPIHASVWGLVPNTIVLVVVSIFTKPVSEEIRLRFAGDVGM